jgi:manganese transport protein
VITAEIASGYGARRILGAALGLNLLLGIPMFPAALLSGVLISAILLLSQKKQQHVERVIIGFVAIIGFAYLIELLIAQPDLGEIASGMLIPRLGDGSLLVAVGIIGATVMPHNLYLHSALVQPRSKSTDATHNRRLYRMTKLDSFIALNGAWCVNSAILIMSAATFAAGGLVVTSIDEAHHTLEPLLGSFSALAFAIALLASGLSSSTTATLASQVISDGFAGRRFNAWARRLAIMIPVVLFIGLGVDPMKISDLSQVSLSFQLPFAMIPLILFTRNRHIMGEYTNTRSINLLAYGITIVIIGLNLWLISQVLSSAV